MSHFFFSRYWVPLSGTGEHTRIHSQGNARHLQHDDLPHPPKRVLRSPIGGASSCYSFPHSTSSPERSLFASTRSFSNEMSRLSSRKTIVSRPSEERSAPFDTSKLMLQARSGPLATSAQNTCISMTFSKKGALILRGYVLYKMGDDCRFVTQARSILHSYSYVSSRAFMDQPAPAAVDVGQMDIVNVVDVLSYLSGARLLVLIHPLVDASNAC